MREPEVMPQVPGPIEPQSAPAPSVPEPMPAEPVGQPVVAEPAPTPVIPTETAPAFEPTDAPGRSHNAHIIALANQKGGVGKTTTTINLGAGLAEKGYEVLIVDFDPQGGCGIGLGVEPDALDLTIYNALLDRSCQVEEVVHKTSFPRLSLIPSNIDLAAAEIMLVQEVAREQSLLRVLTPLRVNYDFILIDSPPSLGLLTINALTAADGVIIPLECEYYALRGMALLMDSIERVRERLNPSLRIDGILPTMVDPRTLHSREVLARVEEAFGRRLFKTNIRKTVRFAEAPVAGEPILTYAPSSPGADAYRSFAEEVIERVATSQPAGS